MTRFRFTGSPVVGRIFSYHSVLSQLRFATVPLLKIEKQK